MRTRVSCCPALGRRNPSPEPMLSQWFRDGLARVLRGVLRDALRGDDDEYGVQLRRTLYVLLLRLLW